MTPKITMTDAPTPDMRKAIVEPLVEFNNGRLGRPETNQPLVILLSDPDTDEIVGGLHGATMFSYLWVDLLFIPESMRRNGIGRKLMMQAEAEALRRGCRAVTLDTFSFQARGFYERLGYSVFGILDDCPPGHSRFYLTKKLDQSRPSPNLQAPSLRPIVLRPARPEDFAFCRRISHETMRWIVERLFGWDEAEQVARFADQWRLDETRIITYGGEAAGWLQTRPADDAVFLGQLYLDSRFQRRGIGTEVMHIIIGEAHGKAVTLGVVKINPALRLYERLGFRITHEDEHKFYMRREPTS